MLLQGLATISLCNACADEIISSGALPVLVAHASSGTVEASQMALETIGNLADNGPHCQQLMAAGVLTPIMNALSRVPTTSPMSASESPSSVNSQSTPATTSGSPVQVTKTAAQLAATQRAAGHAICNLCVCVEVFPDLFLLFI